jgi:hypothetical protein
MSAFQTISPYRAVAILFLGASSVLAQSTSGTITGLVSDPGGAAVAAAPVEAKDLARNQLIRTQTSAGGSYSISGLAPGAYEIKVIVPGFKAAVASSVEVRVAQTTTQNFTLELGQVSESISVSGEAPLINPNSAAVTTTVQNQLLQDLPFNDRSALSAVLLTPGSQGDPQYNGGVQSEMPAVFTQAVTPGGSITVGGGRPGGGSILVDGSDVMSAGNARAVITFSADTVQEVSVQANGIPAQYGRTTGGIINQATKSGANELHGNFTWSHTDPGLQTRFLGSSFGPTARYDTYTGAIGGPVIIPKIYNGTNRTFFWASGEPQRQSLRIGASRVRLPTANVLAGRFRDEYDFLDPTLRARDIDAAIASPIRTNGIYYRYNLNAQGYPVGPQLANSAWTAVPNSDLGRQLAANPLAQNILKTLFPFTPGQNTPNITWLRPDGLPAIDGNNAIFVRGVTSEDNRYSFKIDQLLGDSDRLAFRYSVTPVQGLRYDWGGPSDPGGPIIQDRVNSYNTGLTYNRLFSATVANETRVTYSRGDAFRGPNDVATSQDWGPSLGLLPAVAGVGFPQILGRGANGEGRTLDVNLGIGTDFSLQKGSHSLRLGGEHRRIQMNRISFSGLTGGAYSFSGQVNPPTGSMNDLSAQIGGLILGSLNTYSFQRYQSNAYYRWRYFASFIQDDWKVTPRLTLNLGLRWDYESPRTEKYDRQGWFDPTMTGTVNGSAVNGAFVFANTNGRQRGLWPSNFKGFQPRLGMAYQLKQSVVWRSSFSVLRAPLTGYGNALYPDANVNAGIINSAQGIGGVNPGPINFITNPIGPLPPANVLPRDPIFFMNNTNSFNFSYVPQNNAMPTVYRWNAGFQFLLRNDMAVDIGYDGAKGTHLYAQSVPINAAPFSMLGPLVVAGADFNTLSTTNNRLGIRNSNGSLITGTLIGSLRPYPNWFNRGIGSDYDRSGNSTYHGLNVGFQKRFAAGLTYLASYSWSKSLDDGAPVGNDIYGVTNLQQPIREKGLSNFDTPHKFRSSFSYELPFGNGKWIGGNATGLWQHIFGGFNLSGTVTRQSGYPGVIYLGSSGWYQSPVAGAGNDGFTIRPNIKPGVPLINPNWRVNPFTTNYYNPDALEVPGSPTNPQLGNAPRTLGNGRSPATFTFDAAIAKNIRVGPDGRVNIQLRTDVFNVLNHPVLFLNPNGRNNGLFQYVASTRSFVVNRAVTGIDPNNTGQYGNYAGRMFRLGLRVQF